MIAAKPIVRNHPIISGSKPAALGRGGGCQGAGYQEMSRRMQNKPRDKLLWPTFGLNPSGNGKMHATGPSGCH